MHHFNYQDSRLMAEDVSLEEIAARVGTPAYVYSQATLTRHFQAFKDAFKALDPIICFAVKSNSNRAVMNLFASLGGGADIVSGGELTRALAAGVPAERIVYSGVGKTEEEMIQALKAGILMFNVESKEELEVLDQVARNLGVKAPVSLRVNPDVDAKTHPKITTGLSKNKFGLDVEQAHAQYLLAARMEGVRVMGMSCHIGSQLTDVTPFADALKRLTMLIGRLAEAGVKLTHLDLGGGLGITYNTETPPSPDEYAEAIRKEAGGLGLRLVLEPGRVLVGNAGILLTRVLFTKRTATKRFVVVDAAMNDLARPSLYDAFHAIWPVKRRPGDEHLVADVVGPICETGDFLARDRELPVFRRGDLMAVLSAGAYGMSMSSNYNSRPRAAEVLVNGNRFAVVRDRETVEDLMRGERLADWLK